MRVGKEEGEREGEGEGEENDKVLPCSVPSGIYGTAKPGSLFEGTYRFSPYFFRERSLSYAPGAGEATFA